MEIIEFLGGVAAISGVIAYLGKKAIDSFLAARLEQHKSELQRIATEHSIRFQRLYAERAESIKDTYAKLVALDDALHSTLRPFQMVGEPTPAEKIKQLGGVFNDLRNYFLPRRIFLTEATSKLIDGVLAVSKEVYLDITTYPADPTDPNYDAGNPQVTRERRELWEKARAAHAGEFARIKTDLETEFRRILGIEA